MNDAKLDAAFRLRHQIETLEGCVSDWIGFEPKLASVVFGFPSDRQNIHTWVTVPSAGLEKAAFEGLRDQAVKNLKNQIAVLRKAFEEL